jgi:4a-hydroxytetrahydrobiopterin dehydratase
MDAWSQMKCEPCKGGAHPATEREIAEWIPRIPGWSVVKRGEIPRLEKSFAFKDFANALAFTCRIGELAESEGHHPAILTEWGRVTVSWWTHKINGLHRNDVIMAAKTDDAYAEFKARPRREHGALAP